MLYSYIIIGTLYYAILICTAYNVCLIRTYTEFLRATVAAPVSGLTISRRLASRVRMLPEPRGPGLRLARFS